MKNNITKLIFVITCVFGIFALLSCVFDLDFSDSETDTVEPDRDVFYIYGDSVEALGDKGETDLDRMTKYWYEYATIQIKEIENGGADGSKNYFNIEYIINSDQESIEWSGLGAVLDLSECDTIQYWAQSQTADPVQYFEFASSDGVKIKSSNANAIGNTWEKHTLNLSTDFVFESDDTSKPEPSDYKSITTIEVVTKANMFIDEIHFRGCSS